MKKIFLLSIFFFSMPLVWGQFCVAPSIQSNSIGQTSSTICATGGTITLTIPNFTSNGVIWYYATNVGGPYSVVPAHFTQTETFTHPGYYKYYQVTSPCGNSQSPYIYVAGVASAPVAPSFSSSSPYVCGGIPVTLTATPNDGLGVGFYFYASPSNVQVTNSVSTAGDYYATSLNVCGQSPASNIVTLSNGTAPAAPTISVAKTQLCSGSSITISSTYTQPGSPGDILIWSTGDNGTSTITGYPGNSYTVQEQNACGLSGNSNTITLTTAPTLQGSGQIKFSDVNAILGFGNTNSSINTLTNSANGTVSKSTPYRLSSFYNYCQ
jgi:hypothetical protein